MIYGSWNMERDWQNFLSFWTIFLRFYPTNNPKKIFWAKEKNSGDIIILHMCTIKDNQMIYSSWGMEFDGHIFLWFSTLFFPIYPPEKSKFWKNEKKTPRDIIILHMCTTHDKHKMYSSWDMECDGHNILSFWVIFCPLTTQKHKNFEKMKKMPKDINILHKCNKSHDHMIICYTVPEILHRTDVIFIFYFRIFAALLFP